MGKKKKVEKPVVDKHANFVRVVTPRVNKALKAIRLIGNQAGAAYAPTEKDVANIITALRTQVDLVEKQYIGTGTHDADFALD